MKIFPPVVCAFILCLFCSPVFGSDHPCDTLETMYLLPKVEDLTGLIPAGEVQCAAGEDLFLLIDGGADIYLEYGFTEAVFQSYGSKNGASINLEIYEMKDPGAAYGIYTFKSGPGGVPAAIGHDGRLESYYVNFWKGKYLVTVTGLDPDSGFVDDILEIAGAVDSRLRAESEPPHTVSLLPRNGLRPSGITYLRGPMALRNLYPFDDEDIFGFKEGAAGDYNDHTLFVFQYGGREEAESWYEHAKMRLKRSDRFFRFADRDTCLEMSDRRDHRILIKHRARWMVIVLAAPDADLPGIMAEAERRLTD